LLRELLRESLRESKVRTVRFIGMGAAMSPLAEQIVLEAAKSAELRTEFERLRWATDLDQHPKFSSQVCDKLSTLVVTRSYAPQVLQLCHLIYVARQLAGEVGYLFFFMELDSARSDRFRRQLAQLVDCAPSRAESIIKLRDDGVEISYPDGIFVVYFRQMPLLSALLEFCVNALELAVVDEIFREVSDGGITATKVSGAANRVSSLLYAYLKENLPAVQEQRKHRHLIAYLVGRCGEAFGTAEIDDEAVLDFWCEEAGKENSFGTDFRLYKTVAKAFVHLRETLDLGRELYALARADAVGQQRSGGEVDPGVFEAAAFAIEGEPGDEPPAHLRPWAIEGVVQAIDGEESPLALLAEPPLCRVKFLNEREKKDLETVIESGEQATSMPLSILRSDVFGPVQRRVGRASESRPREIIAREPPQSYVERQERLDALLLHLGRVAAATAHVIADARGNDSDGEAETVIDLSQRRSAQAAFKKLNRAGFDASSLKDPEIIDAFQLAAGPLLAIHGRLTRYRERLAGISHWDAIWEQDTERFAAQFERLYGEIR
jgi:hypothetical protein